MIKVSELQSKDVVSITDGKRLGMIGDLDIDLENGMIRAIVVPSTGRFFGLFGSSQDYVIPWNQIVKIGADVVLVELNPSSQSFSPPSFSPRSGGSSDHYGGNSGGY
ncbi:YlmC/YmxH family sporulation protein [Effusibacillus lacus]|uniref:YlmC/YmxH family sporulation protein n=1 Tax=Effusibacillus lacus TaxID=1348429 RepID=A0A292YRF6_9BACL|nr:YlmC/YmxH family sporulation protein [Effusibacillus lacus]TCS75673.1 YlmC/YmxH family sporulation protein [Effusibacillus lacus]GAX90994.1 YlmC/YmxH family sporulation protein [Effusibacillus lacus]